MSASVIRRSSKQLVTLSCEGRRIQFHLSNVGSFLSARCEDPTVTVQQAQACLETIQFEIVEKETSFKTPGRCPSFGWHMGGIVANWGYN